MSLNEEVVCPWCQTDIVWDPEIGPEDECPHCLNELGDYRTVDFDLEAVSDLKHAGRPMFVEDDAADDSWDDVDEPLDSYRQTIQQLTDEQEAAPECSGCHEFMLLVGHEQQEQHAYAPNVVEWLRTAVLPAPFTLQVYVCPSCFKVDKFLSEEDREAMVQRIKQQ